MATTILQQRIDKRLKDSAESILKSQGFKPSQAITIFYTEIERTGGFPFLPSKLEVPNKKVAKAIREAEMGIEVETYKDPKELFEMLNNL